MPHVGATWCQVQYFQSVNSVREAGAYALLNPHDIEAKWLARWNAADLYRFDPDHAERPFNYPMEFPHPSGEDCTSVTSTRTVALTPSAVINA